MITCMIKNTGMYVESIHILIIVLSMSIAFVIIKKLKIKSLPKIISNEIS